jgi:DNA-binding SARP family transcriptional activator
MLGAPALETEQGAAVPGLGPGKPLAVLCYLAVRGSARRDELIALLWGDVDEKRARNAFRQTLHRLRSAVPGLIGVDAGERIHLDMSKIRTDLSAFERAISSAAWESAAELYRGEFLEGFDPGGSETFFQWLDDVRGRVRAQWQGALHAVASAALDAGDVERALAGARQLLAADPASEDAILIEAQALGLAGRGTEAVSLLEMHADRLHRDFGAPLPAAAADMLRRLRSTPGLPPRVASAGAAAAAVPSRHAAQAARLLREWRHVTTEQAGVSVLIEARTGADAHALTEDVVRRITAAAPALVLVGHESSAGAEVPYASVAEALRGALRAPGLAGVSDHLLAEAARLVPELRDRFALPPAGPIADEAARVRVFEGVASMVEALAYEQPVCMVLEDLERAAPSTIDLIAYLVRRLRASPVMFIATTRPTHAPVARLVREGIVGGRLALDGVPDDAWLTPPPPAGTPLTPGRTAIYAAGFALLVVAATLVWSNIRSAAGVTGPALALADTLLLTDATGARAVTLSGDVTAPQTRARAYQSLRAEPPWLNPRAAPVGGLVAVERLSSAGTDVYLINGADTTALAATPDDDLVGGWSPDGRRLLIIRGHAVADGYRAGLWAYPVDGTTPTAIDTARGRSVVEAAWSPTGARIAWVARIGPDLQSEVFVADASGARVRDVSVHPGEDYHIAWAPDGSRLAFTSDRTGDAEIFVRDLNRWELWRITFDAAHDDAARFARDGGIIVFESTRGGTLGIYAVRAYGGEPLALLADAAGMRIDQWLAPPHSYIDEVRIAAPTIAPGDSAAVAASIIMTEGDAAPAIPLVWRSPDSTVVAVRPSGGGVVAHARNAGAARLIAEVPGWRSDTAVIVVGAGPATWIADDFRVLDSAQWRVLGRPAPRVRDGAVVLRADREWPSGILAERLIPLDRTVDIEVSVRAPFDARAPLSFVVALVQPGAVDPVAPQPVHVAAVQWDGSAGRFAFSVGPETASESHAASAGHHVLAMRVQHDGRVAFLVDGRIASISTLQLRDVSQAQLWIGGVGTGDVVAIDAVRVRIGDALPR